MTGDVRLPDAVGLDGRTALVTGGGNGMGLATALLLADAGCDVSIVDVDAAAAEAAAEQVRSRGRRAAAITADMSTTEAPARAVAETVDALGELSVAVNFAGGTAGVMKPFLDITPEEWQRPLALNLTSTLLSCQAQALSMIRGGRGGTIVTVGSSSGITAAPNLAGYGAANAAVIHLTKTMALELAPYDIRVNCLVPGTHWSAGTRHRATSPDSPPGTREFFQTAERVTPLGHLGEPAETAGVALFLASELSRYMTGHHVVSDGGILHTTARPAFGAPRTPDAVTAALGAVKEENDE
ncbi:SDR family oxidoreductase [Microbacterium sp. CFH 31415]|uniref:SDR family NAD(P)-dependent oxidoreductase n=1 Tax=Microbacterium sp. CFH 31415 TaxID=2921732 RepID=UPI001F1350C1|nr:SDR family NAD(P)-dependent oxidoreductase [Microbacterium sp. CFH 31415]MCH6231636.1 SDR family oxidoreductase [Microbacterium sp. CFH 31415]